jgi:hypothetical protein
MDALEERDSYDAYAPPLARTVDPVPVAHEPAFFPVGPAKFAVLSVCTLGFYIVYWFYKSWRQVPGKSGGSSAKAAAAAIFCPLTAYSLFREIERFEAQAAGPARTRATALALFFFLFAAAGRLPDPYGLACLLAFAPLLPVVRRVNRLNAELRPLANRNTRFSLANIAGAAIGGLILLAAVAEMIWGEAG